MTEEHDNVIGRLEQMEAEYKATPFWKKLPRFQYWLSHESMLNPFVAKNEIKYFVQRGRRGYSDRDIWGLDGYLSEMLIKALDQQNRERHSMFTFPHPDDETVGPWEEQWNENHKDDDKKTAAVYEAMIEGFKAARAILDMERMDGKPFDPMYRFEAEYEKMNKGLDLFKEHFLGLWD